MLLLFKLHSVTLVIIIITEPVPYRSVPALTCQSALLFDGAVYSGYSYMSWEEAGSGSQCTSCRYSILNCMCTSTLNNGFPTRFYYPHSEYMVLYKQDRVIGHSWSNLLRHRARPCKDQCTHRATMKEIAADHEQNSCT